MFARPKKQNKTVFSQYLNNDIISICKEQLLDIYTISFNNRFVDVNVCNCKTETNSTQSDKAIKQRTSNAIHKDVSLIEEYK